MQITKFVAVAVVLTARICQAKIVIGTSSPDETTSDLVKDLVDIVTSCYKDRITGIGLAGNLPDTLIRTLSVQHLIPTILMDDTSDMINATILRVARDQFRYKLQVFIVGVSSWNELTTTIQFIIKTSIWWNHMASFIILDQSPRCTNILKYLYVAWQNDLLNAKVMCRTRIGRRRIFNYNPFTSQAPDSWAHLHVFDGPKNHPVTLFMRQYLENNVKCLDLDFIKTNNLGGYEISVDGKSETLEFTNKYLVRTSQEWARQKRIVSTLYRVVNATPKFTDRNVSLGELHGEMSMRYIPLTLSNRMSYPYQRRGAVIISQFKGHKSQLEKIMSITDIYSRIGMGIVYLVTLIFFKFFVHRAFVPAILNLVRMTCNTGFTNLPDNTATRIYLTGLLFFVVTMQGIYQGNLASLLTNVIPYKNIDSIKDLVNRDYKIYGMEHVYSLIKDAGLEERFTIVDHPFDCIMFVVHDLSAVCVSFADGYIMDSAQNHSLHLSQQFVAEYPLSFYIQWFWYFEEQMNVVLGRMMEADIYEPWDMKCSPLKLSDFQFDKEVLKNTDYKVIELTELLFAFVILGIGLACATVTFIVEVAIYRY